MHSLRVAMRMLWAPRATAREAARASLWLPLALLFVASAFAGYPQLIQLGGTQLAQARLDATPDGMYPGSIFFFLGLTIASPILLPISVWVVARLTRLFMWLFLDVKVKTGEVLRITAYGFLPLVLERVLAGSLVLTGGPDSNRFNPLASNLAFFLAPKETSIFAYETARGLDAFSLWALVLMARGLGGLTEEESLPFFLPPALIWFCGVLLRAWLLS